MNLFILQEAIAIVNLHQYGRFSYTLGNLKVSDRTEVSAIHPQYGTSEPVVNTVVRSIAEPASR